MHAFATALGALTLGSVEVSDRSVNIVLFVVVVVAAIFFSRHITRLMRVALGNSSVGEVSIIVNLSRAAIIFTAAYIVGENVFHLELTGLARALGVTTLLVSLGLQDFIKNIVAGIQVVVTHLFHVGDHLDIGDLRGEVLDINWRQTTLRDKDGNPHVVPNSLLMNERFMRRDGKMARRYLIDCDIKPGLDLERVAADIERLANEVLTEKGWKAEEDAEVRFVGSTANGVRTSIRIFLKDIEFTTAGQDAVMRAIGQRGYLADWTNDNPGQQQWR